MENDQEHLVPEDHPLSILINTMNEARNLITSRDVIRSIRPGDSSLIIIGKVIEISAERTVQIEGRSCVVLNFVLDCNEMSVCVSIWDNEIRILRPYIKNNAIIYLDGPYARPATPSRYNYNLNFTLICRSNTKIHTLGKIEPENDNINALKRVAKSYAKIDDWIQDPKPDEYVYFDCYIKTEFRKLNVMHTKKVGVLTDNINKITATVLTYDSEAIFEAGEPVKIFGKFIETDKKIEFQIRSVSDIVKRVGQKLTEDILDAIFSTPKRKSENNSTLDSEKVCLGFVQNLDTKGVSQTVTNQYVLSGDYEVDIAGIKFHAKCHLHSPNLPTKFPDQERDSYHATRDHQAA